MIKTQRRWIWLTTLLAIALFVSLGANYLLYKQGEDYYRQLNAVRLDPIGLYYFQDYTQPQSNKPLVVFYGDSRAARWTTPDDPGFKFVNRGIGAQTSAQVLERFDAHIKPLKPNIIIIQVGINDLKTIPIFPGNKQAIIDNCKANIRRIVEQSNDLGATVIATTIFPMGQVSIERTLFWSDDVALAIQEVNVFIHSLANDKIIVFDSFAILANDSKSIKPEYSQDLLHLTPLGYQRLNTSLTLILSGLTENFSR